MLKTALKTVVIGGGVLLAASYAFPAPVASAIAWVENATGFTPATCAMAPTACFDVREHNLTAVLAKLREGRSQAELGLRTITEEETRQRTLLDANTGLQTVLRARAADMLRAAAPGLTFQGKAYSRAEAEQQAQMLVREEAGFRTTLESLAARRVRLGEARMSAVVEDNRLSGALTTLSAEKAVVVATGSLDQAKRLLDESFQAERQAEAVSDSVVRSTREMAPQPASAPSGPAFDFNAWVSGGATAQPEAH